MTDWLLEGAIPAGAIVGITDLDDPEPDELIAQGYDVVVRLHGRGEILDGPVLLSWHGARGSLRARAAGSDLGSPCRPRVRVGGRVTDRLLDAKEVAARLGVPESWVRESARAGAMPYVRLGRYVRFDLADVEAWIETCKTPGRSIGLRSRDAAKAAEGGK